MSIKNAINITDKTELANRVGEKLKAPVFYQPVGCDKCDNTGYK
jgi:type II secretory ATPase GspE/PulE/Tfp pilus assembly ATPase PilB-like protein